MHLEDQPQDEERNVRFGSSAYRLWGNCKKRAQGVRKEDICCSMGE
jgi:hypothetical protein